MGVGTWTQPDYTLQTAAAYKANIDACFAVSARFADAFAPHENSPAAMNIKVDAGFIWNGTAITEKAQQTSGTITAPVGNPRYDRVVYDPVTGDISIITGTPAASPAVPAITGGKLPICRILLQTSSVAITNSMITDERVMASSNIPVVSDITGNVTLAAGDIGKTFQITAAADITLPALSSVPIGAVFEFISATLASHRLYPNGSETLDGTNTFYRIPSYECVRVRKITASNWRIVDRPQFGVGAIMEVAADANTVAQLYGPGWATCDGSAISRSTYGNLAAAFNYSGSNYRWGNGDGATTFNLPDDRGRASIGSGTGSGLSARSLAQTGGAETVALGISEIPSHSHPGSGDYGHSHYFDDVYSYAYPAGGAGPCNAGGDIGITTTTTGNNTATGYASIYVGAQGGSGAHNNMQPFNVKLKLVKL